MVWEITQYRIKFEAERLSLYKNHTTSIKLNKAGLLMTIGNTSAIYFIDV